MGNDKNKTFINLLKKRREMSGVAKSKKNTISKNDPQLVDLLKNFNESKEYKILKNIK